MPKQKGENNGAVAVQDDPQLALTINLDDIESINVSATPEPEQEQVVQTAPVPDSDDAIIATVQTFDQAFAGDPLANDWLEFGLEAKATIDPTDKAPRYVKLGHMLTVLEDKERKLAPGSYERAKVIKKGETALRCCNVPESMVRPNELLGMYWVVHLDRSTPGGENEARSFDHSPIQDDWFGGNISVGVLRTLAVCIDRVSKPSELDVYEFKSGYEAKVRGWIKSLRAGDLTNNQTEAFIASHKKFLALQKEHAELAGLSPAEREALANAKRVETRERRLQEIKSDALTFQKNAAEKLKLGADDLRTLLSDMQIIPPYTMMTPQEYARIMTPGDAKALVQELIRSYPADPKRLDVFKVLHHTCRSIAEQIKNAATQKSEQRKAG
jgi:hypothetical protein